MRRKLEARIKLGLFITAGISLFIFAIYYIGKQKNMFGDTFRVSGIFHNVGGLQVGNNIRFSGINVGTVEAIEIITDTTVRVDMLIEKHVQQFIKKDATAIIGNDGLMGNKIISIAPGSAMAESVTENDYIRTSRPVEIDDIMVSLKITGENAAIITSDLADIVHKINSGEGTIGKLLLDSAFAEEFENTIYNVKKGTEGFSENMEALKGNFLLRGYYKNKERKKEKAREEREKAKEEKEKDKASDDTTDENERKGLKGIFKRSNKTEKDTGNSR